MIYSGRLKQFYSEDLSLYSHILYNSVAPEDFFLHNKIRGLFWEPLIISTKGLKQSQWKSYRDLTAEVNASATF